VLWVRTPFRASVVAVPASQVDECTSLRRLPDSIRPLHYSNAFSSVQVFFQEKPERVTGWPCFHWARGRHSFASIVSGTSVTSTEVTNRLLDNPVCRAGQEHVARISPVASVGPTGHVVDDRRKKRRPPHGCAGPVKCDASFALISQQVAFAGRVAKPIVQRPGRDRDDAL